MKRLVVALSLAVAATTAQAQTAGDRIIHPSHDNPSLVTALKNWLASKASPNTATKAAPRIATHGAEPRQHAAVEIHPRRWHHTRHYRVTENKASKANATPKDAAPRNPAPVEAAPKDVTAPAPQEAVLKDAAPNDVAASAIAPRDVAPNVAMAEPPVAPAAPVAAAAPTLASINPNMPRTVATITVVAPSANRARTHHGPSQCTSGERIITAYYWEGR